MGEFILFAAKQKSPQSPEEAAWVLLGVIVIAVIYLVGAACQPSKEYVERNGIPCCPRCGRQISLKAARPNCRSCGHNLMTGPSFLKTYQPSPAEHAPERGERERQRLLREERARKERAAWIEEEEEREAAARLKEQLDETERLDEKRRRREAMLETNGGYTDLQLYGVGALIVLVPVALAAGAYFMFRG